MNLLKQQIKDKACTVCDGIYPSGRAKEKARCALCKVSDKSEWELRKH